MDGRMDAVHLDHIQICIKIRPHVTQHAKQSTDYMISFLTEWF